MFYDAMAFNPDNCYVDKALSLYVSMFQKGKMEAKLRAYQISNESEQNILTQEVCI